MSLMKQLVGRRRICQKPVKYLTIKIRKTSSDVSSLYQLEFHKKGIFSHTIIHLYRVNAGDRLKKQSCATWLCQVKQ